MPHWEGQELQPELRAFVGAAGWLKGQAQSEHRRRAASEAARPLTPEELQNLSPQEMRELRLRRDTIAVAGPGMPKLMHFVLGRPVLLLQMGHPGMTQEEKVPYLASVFAPAPVTLVLGRLADSVPACPRNRAVFSTTGAT